LDRVLVGVVDGHRDHGRRGAGQPLPGLLHSHDSRDGHLGLSDPGGWDHSAKRPQRVATARSARAVTPNHLACSLTRSTSTVCLPGESGTRMSASIRRLSPGGTSPGRAGSAHSGTGPPPARSPSRAPSRSRPPGLSWWGSAADPVLVTSTIRYVSLPGSVLRSSSATASLAW